MKNYLEAANKTRSLEQTLLDFYTKQSHKLTKENTSYTQSIQKLTCDLEETKIMHAKIIEENMKLKQTSFEQEDKIKEINCLKLDTDKLTKENNKIKRENVKLNENNENLKKENKNYKKEIENLKKEIEIFKKENELIKSENEKLKKSAKNDSKMNKKQALNFRETELKNEVSELTRINADFINEINELKNKIKLLEKDQKQTSTKERKNNKLVDEIFSDGSSENENFNTNFAKKEENFNNNVKNLKKEISFEYTNSKHMHESEEESKISKIELTEEKPVKKRGRPKKTQEITTKNDNKANKKNNPVKKELNLVNPNLKNNKKLEKNIQNENKEILTSDSINEFSKKLRSSNYSKESPVLQNKYSSEENDNKSKNSFFNKVNFSYSSPFFKK